MLSVDSWGFMIFFLSSILYFVIKKPELKALFLFLSGVGLGMFIGTIFGSFRAYVP